MTEQNDAGAIHIPIALGEFLDKLTILRIKSERIGDPLKLTNIHREIAVLEQAWRGYDYRGPALDADIEHLKTINEALWDIEDRLREKEARQTFDAEFIELARRVYITNDERAALKKRINLKSGSRLLEEKSYARY